MGEAPYFSDVALGPDPSAASWITAEDGKRLRCVAWNGPKSGTILLFSGRTEYAEKYGDVVAQFAKRDLAVATCDWRGQGLSERYPRHHQIGEVDAFSDYQKDVAALIQFAKDQGMPEPYYALGHSLGGGILLRALHNNLPVEKALFSAPMWGIQVPVVLRSVSSVVIAIYRALGAETRLAPGRDLGNYVELQPFEGNSLTHDPLEYDVMRHQLEKHPELGLGGPSVNWVDLALRECADLAKLSSPNIECLTIYAGEEEIVCNQSIEKILANWPSAQGVLVPGASHEVFLEVAEKRRIVWSEVDTFLGLQPT